MTAEQGSSAASVYGQTDSGLSSADSIPAHAINSRTSPRKAGLFATLALAVAACGIGLKPTERTEVFEEDVAITDGIDYSDFYSEALTPDPFLEPGRDIAVGGDQGDARDTSAIVREIGSPFPPREDIRITNGRHGRGGAAVDLALLERVECNSGSIVGDGPLKDWTVVASESGELKVVGGEKIIVDGKEITDPNRSVVIIKSDKGKIGYTHIQPLDALKRRVKSGDKSIEEGEPIGKVTCEFPPGGNSTGFHVHLFTIDSEGKAEPFGADIEGWTFGIDPQNGETIATKGNEVRYVCGGICNSGPRKNVLPIGDPNATIPRVREPKPVQPTQTEESLDGPFVPKNPEEFVRYQIAEMLFRSFNESRGGYGYWIKWTEMSGADVEEVKRKLARGEKVGSIPMYEIGYPSDSSLELYLYDDQGDIYEEEMRLIRAEYRDAHIELDRDPNGPEVRNGYRIVWSGEITFTGEIKYGAADIIARDTVENLKQIARQGSGFAGFDKIIKQSPWIFKDATMHKIYVYETGDVECNGDNIAFNDINGCYGSSFGITNTFKLYIEGNDGGYNGQFVIEP